MLDPQVEIDLCRPCESLWFDVGELSRLPSADTRDPRTKAQKVDTSLREEFLQALIDHLPNSLGEVIGRWLSH